VHLAVLCASDLYPTVQSFLGQPRPEHARAMRAAAALALISGPSRTADIEMTLTIGVHGPKELHVFCVEDA
jgi:L-lactate dehydrogenase complex protein LldG